jgi:membrane protease YdiL (CAAX protease family)
MTPASPRWGPWSTMGWSLLVMGVFISVEIAFATAYWSATMGAHVAGSAADRFGKLSRQGDVLAVMGFLATPASLLALIAIVKLKGATFEEALALRMPEPRVLVRWLLVALAFAAVSDALTWALGQPLVPEYVAAVYRSAEGKGALWLAIVVAAPVMEEALFRGFMLTGLMSSRLGARGAVIVCALCWALLHPQYDAYGMATLFALGLLLGAARVTTGSILPPLAMHMAANLVATLEAALL